MKREVSFEELELKRLKNELKEVRMKYDILKKVVSIFSNKK
ncbi:MAG: hypothetical protein QMB65_02905 [Vicingaceae bacterium]